jgi:adenylate kinase
MSDTENERHSPNGETESPNQEEKRVPRVFVNYLDTYTARAIGELLSKSFPGISRMDGEEEEGDEDELKRQRPASELFQICGTVTNPDFTPPFACTIIDSDEASIQAALMSADYIIYSIAEGGGVAEAQQALEFLKYEAAHFLHAKTFVLVSTCLTWNITKPLDMDDPEIPFTEDDYRKRRSSPSYKDHIALEKLAIKFGKTLKKSLSCYVICAGVCYGNGEHMLHSFFKRAWLGEQALPIYGTAHNVIPLIHVRDLATIVTHVIDAKPRTRYILAVDQGQSTLREVMKAISSSLTTGKLAVLGKEEAQASSDIGSVELDALLVNLRMEGVLVREELNFKWHAEEGLVDKIDLVTQEFKDTRGLLPIKINILGPPGVGKTAIAKALATHYRIHHITASDMIADAQKQLEEIVAKEGTTNQGGGDDEEEEDDEGRIEEASELLQSIKDNLEANQGRLDDQLLVRLYRNKITSKPALNQGVIMDGFPKTYEQAKMLYEAQEDEDGEPQGTADPATIPELVIDLTATEAFLKQRMMSLPEEQVQGTHNTEEGFLRRLSTFIANRSEEDTVINGFDEQEIDVTVIDVTKSNDESNGPIIELIKKTIGSPRNYGLTIEEKEELARKELIERESREAQERALKEKHEREEREARKKNIEVWTAQLSEVRKQEKEMLEAKARPFRQYIMAHVMPTLTAGLIECAKLRPEDPVDYIAEYLYQHNPELE